MINKNSAIAHAIANKLEDEWSLNEHNPDHCSVIMEAISNYSQFNSLDLSQELSKEDYQFLTEDLSKKGVFSQNDKNSIAFKMWKTHRQALDSFQD